MQGWPFLVARGRRSGYTVLLAPDFLISQYGVLEDIAGSGARTVVRTVNGRALTIVWSEHTVAGADVGADEAPRDEHSRPLHLLHGLVIPATNVQPSEVDMSRSLHAALVTYRRFLAGEEHFTVESSGPFQLESPTAEQPRTAPSPLAPRKIFPVVLVGLVAIIAIAVIVMTSRPSDPPDSCPPTTTQPATTTPEVTMKPTPAQPGQSC